MSHPGPRGSVGHGARLVLLLFADDDALASAVAVRPGPELIQLFPNLSL